MFTVIIPLYNKANSIKDTINSVLNQTFAEFEIIVVNDGSTDKSMEIVSEITDERLVVFEKKNGGVSSARNLGIKEAKNSWITFLDGDDQWEPNHLEEYAKVIENYGVNWLFSGYTSTSISKSYINIYSKSGFFQNIFDDLKSGLKIHTSTVCIKRSLFDVFPELFFREGMNNSEDREVWYKLCCIDNKPYYIDQALSRYSLDDRNSLTKTHSVDHFLTVFDRLAESTIYAKTSIENQEKIKEYLMSFNRNAIKGYYLRNKVMKSEYKIYLTKAQWILLNNTSLLPIIFKRIFLRLC